MQPASPDVRPTIPLDRRTTTLGERISVRTAVKGQERVDAVNRRIRGFKEFAVRAIGATEIPFEIGGTALDKAGEIRDRAVSKAKEIRDIAVSKKDAAIATYRAKEAEMQMRVGEQRDKLVARAKELGHKGADAVVSGINTVAGVAETGVGIAVGGAMAGAYAVERGVRTTIAEVQAVPRELKAQAQEGLASLALSVADRAMSFADRRIDQVQSHRTAAAAVRTRFAQPGPVGRMMGK